MTYVLAEMKTKHWTKGEIEVAVDSLLQPTA